MHHYDARVIADQATGRPLAGIRATLLDAETQTVVQAYRDGVPVTLVSGAHGLISEFETEETTRRVHVTAGPVRLTMWCSEIMGGALAAADRAEAAASSLTPQTLPGDVDLDTLTDAPRVWTTTGGGSDWAAKHYPAAVSGTVEVQGIGGHATARLMTMTTPQGRIFLRERNAGGTWGAWAEVGAKVATVAPFVAPAGADADAFTRDTLAQIGGGVSNVPTGFGVGIIETLGVVASNVHMIQRATGDTGRVWVRRMTSGTWGAWVEVGGTAAATLTLIRLGADTDADLLARDTVAQSGGGTANVPAGFSIGVIETLGINASASYLLQRATSSTGRVWVRYKSGTWGAWAEVGAGGSSGSGVALGSVDLNASKAGDRNASLAAFTNGPAGMAAGHVSTVAMNASESYLLQTATEWTYAGTAGRLWTRRKSGSTWSAWALIGPTDVAALPTVRTTRPGSGTKLVRVPVTVGHNPASVPAVTAQGTARLPLRWNFPIVRWRLRVQNTDIRSGSTTRTGTADVTGVWVGEHDGSGGFKAAPVKALGPFSVSNAETVTPWTSTPVPTSATGEVLLSLGWTATGDHWPQLGSAYLGADPAAAGAQSGTGLTRSLSAPWSIVVEVETWATTPVLASMGDSISVGVGTTRGTVESWLVQYAQPRGIVPILGGSSGDRAAASTDLTAHKWTRWLNDQTARPDALIFALGINDFGNGDTDQALRNTMTALLPQVTARVPALHLTEITPRTGVPLDDPKEAARATHNEWRRGLPLGARAVWPFVAAVSADGDNLDADKNQDGLHPNSAGHAALAGALGTMTSPPVAYQAPTA